MLVTPVTLPPGRLRLATSSRLNGVCSKLEDNWNRLCGSLRCECSKGASGENDFHLAPNEIGRKRRKAIVVPLRPAIFDCNVLAVNITGFF